MKTHAAPATVKVYAAATDQRSVGSKFEIAILALPEMLGEISAWQDLSSRAAEDNVYYSPQYVWPSSQLLASQRNLGLTHMRIPDQRGRPISSVR